MHKHVNALSGFEAVCKHSLHTASKPESALTCLCTQKSAPAYPHTCTVGPTIVRSVKILYIPARSTSQNKHVSTAVSEIQSVLVHHPQHIDCISMTTASSLLQYACNTTTAQVQQSNLTASQHDYQKPTTKASPVSTG